MDTKMARGSRDTIGKSVYSGTSTQVVPRKYRVLPKDQPRNKPYNGTRNSIVWTPEQSHVSSEKRPRKMLNCDRRNPVDSSNRDGELSDSNAPKTQGRVCKFWVSDKCLKGDKCNFLHSWFHGEGFAMLATLEGHKKVIKGIALPSGSEKLYSASKDGTAQVWDCHTGQCIQVINLGAEVGSLISEGPWVFIGIPNVVKAWNIQTGAEFNLEGPVGQVNAMVVGDNMLLAGAQDGTILVWKGNTETDPFQKVACLKGHTSPVVCLCIGRGRLYSGSIAGTIRVWDLNTLQLVTSLKGHKEAVTSLLCWDQFLLSCSLDRTLKFWGTSEKDVLKVFYTHTEQQGILSLCGITGVEDKPILFCSSNDNIVHLYDLPLFTEQA
ncbi:zinc finger CCCH domain-containing protein 48-like isoform X2 [Carica papaya]|uniref:zinc finger CCCH domain-containing protein 48-like isoform X2 n=1 Tax=Carica papaya TaxID=3649 RepID=UPI000B8CC2A1|nr:zinc finger CCCH domain-containing protein 48-like isoform X2 [Carica papaya]